MIEPALDWATAPGPPNYVFFVALLTAPHLWAKQIKRRVTPLFDRWFPSV